MERLPNINADDVNALLSDRADFSDRETLVLSNEIINITNGNTLSVVYAVHAMVARADVV